MIRYSALIRGVNLFPKNIKCLMDGNIKSVRSPGDIVNGSILDYGACSFFSDSIEEVVSKVKDVIREIYPKELEFVEVNVTYFYEEQCNLEFSTNELNMIRKIGGVLTVTCCKYQEEETDADFDSLAEC